MTESCDDARPQLIIHVVTIPALVVDWAVVDPLHAALAAKDLLPRRVISSTPPTSMSGDTANCPPDAMRI